MVAIINCESGFVHYKSDGTILKGNVTPHDGGVAQINKDYHEAEAKRLGYDLDTIYGNLGYARHLFEREGHTPWVCKKVLAHN